MAPPSRRFRTLWFPNLGSGALSFLIEAVIVLVLASTGLIVAALALWLG